MSVNQGLALAGRIDFKFYAFTQEIEELLSSEKFRNTIENEFPILFNSISRSFFDYCIEISLENFHKWSTGECETLRELENNTISEIKILVAEKGEDIFVCEIAEWISRLSPKVDALTSIICKKYNISEKALTIPIKASSVEINTGKLENFIKLGDSATKILGSIAGVLAVGISGYLLLIVVSFLNAIAMNIAFFIGWLGVSIVFVATQFVSKGILDTKIKDANIPVKIRDILLTENQFKAKMEEKRYEIERELSEAIDKEFSLLGKKEEVFNTIKINLKERADEARILIK